MPTQLGNSGSATAGGSKYSFLSSVFVHFGSFRKETYCVNSFHFWLSRSEYFMCEPSEVSTSQLMGREVDRLGSIHGKFQFRWRGGGVLPLAELRF